MLGFVYSFQFGVFDIGFCVTVPVEVRVMINLS